MKTGEALKREPLHLLPARSIDRKRLESKPIRLERPGAYHIRRLPACIAYWITPTSRELVGGVPKAAVGMLYGTEHPVLLRARYMKFGGNDVYRSVVAIPPT
jgi:hypothetical protein